jgi:hypothetical protein
MERGSFAKARVLLCRGIIMSRRSRQASRGVTRVELLLLVGALGLLGGAAALFSSHAAADTDLKAAEADARRVLRAADNWRLDNPGLGCPTVSQLVEDEMLSATTRTDDPWGSRYRISCEGQETQVFSAGVDRRARTADDIRVGSPLNT